MSKSTRAFIGIPVPETSTEKLERLKNGLNALIPSVRWVAGVPYHLTLAFLGEVPDADLNQVCQATAKIAAGFSPFELTLRGVGAFPNPSRPRVLWAGLAGVDESPLFALQTAVAKAMTGLGFRPDDRFSPHVTLGRLRDDRRSPSQDLTKILQSRAEWSGGTFKVSEVITYGSTLTPEGPTYAPLARARLRGNSSHHLDHAEDR